MNKNIKILLSHFINRILELPKNNIYPYSLSTIKYSLFRKKDCKFENIDKYLIISRLIYEIENINVNENEIKYSFIDKSEKSHNPTIRERIFLIIKYLIF